MLWQNGVRVLEVTNFQTNYAPLANGYQTWSVNNYSNGLTPAIATIYIDNAAISRTRVGTAIVPPPPTPPPFAAILAALSSIADGAQAAAPVHRNPCLPSADLDRR